MNAIAYSLMLSTFMLCTSCVTHTSQSKAEARSLESITASLEGYVLDDTRDWFPSTFGECGWHGLIRLHNPSQSAVEWLAASFPRHIGAAMPQMSVRANGTSGDFPRELDWVNSKGELPAGSLWALKRYGLANVRTGILEPGETVDVPFPIFELPGRPEPMTNQFILEHGVPGSWPYTSFVASFALQYNSPTNRATE